MAGVSQPRRARIKSAHARLESSASSRDDACSTSSGLNFVDYSRTTRAQSARLLKREHEASRFVFPLSSPSFDSTTQGRQATSYGEQFAPKFGRPATARPTSSTRRHKPHPASRFMAWTLPTKVVDHPRALGPSEEILTDTREKFYEDYAGDRNVGDSKSEVLTQLTTLPFPGASLRDVKTPGKMTEDFGLTGTKIEFDKGAASSSQEKSISKKQAQELIGQTVKASASSALKKWLEKATEEEKGTVMRMLSASSSNEKQMQTLLDVIHPDMLPGVEDWMKTAAESDKTVVYNMLRSLKETKELTRDSRMIRRPKQSNPTTLRTTRHHVPSATYPQVQVSDLPRFVGDGYNRWVYAMETGQDVSLQKPIPSGNPNVLWHHKSKRNAPPVTFNQGSIFAAANKYPAQHFAIIPEWPIA
ncbi:uncharacterized protein [Oscarella lobularis]|uniref:uncharacterized protein n=1 Tax=Oscarella lobularis TaxID=121494 RepID=UPI0033132BB8